MSDLYHVALESLDIGLAGDCASHFERCHADVVASHVGLADEGLGLCTASRINFQHVLDDFSCSVVQRFVGSVLAPLDPLVQILLTRASEREISCEHYVQQNAQCPYIDRHAFIIRFLRNFWSHI